MFDSALVEGIKTGLKGEMDSVTLYTDAAGRTDGDIKVFFIELAEEEKRHFNWLLQYYRDLSGDKAPDRNLASEAAAMTGRGPIVTEAFIKRLAGNQHLVTAIASAVLLELNAVKHYSVMAEKTTVPAVKDFFKVLAGWEQKHYEDLLRIQEESRASWFDAQHFEPF
jgi:rubrerythrin